MKFLFNFGEDVESFSYKVINEREARASAGIMFLLGLLSLFSVYIFRTLLWAELFSITFIFEFFIRITVSPKYAPYMLLAELIVYNQEPDWVEAEPKKFAWALGMVLGLVMGYYILFDVITMMRLGVCLVCLSLLFLESSFGICLGCLFYHSLNIKLNRCPGGVCEVQKREPYNPKKLLLLIGFSTLFILTYTSLEYQENIGFNNIIINGDNQ